MEQNKLENQIREKLNSREIQPSAQAWDRLDAMLSVAEEKKTKRSFGWLYIAASVTVLLTVGMFLFTQNGSQIELKDEVVTTETKDTVQKPVKEIQSPIVEQKEVIVSNETQLEPKPKTAILNSESQITNNNQRVSVINRSTSSNQSNQIIRDQEIKYENSSDVALKELPKTVEPKEIVFNRSKNSTALTDEQLLASLDNSAKKLNKKASVKVDAKSFLSEVDGELEMTFREKVIDKVSKKYKKIEVALANRNNE